VLAELKAPGLVGCALAGRAIAEIERLRRGWVRAIQIENECDTTNGSPCNPKGCECVETMEMLANEQS
jgi:hypothetical protein